jgi:hypothetical protein
VSGLGMLIFGNVYPVPVNPRPLAFRARLGKVGTGFPKKTRSTKNLEPIPIPTKRDRL